MHPAPKTVHLNNFKMASKRTSVVLSIREDLDEDNDNGKKKSKTIKSQRSLTGAETYKTECSFSSQSGYPVKAVQGDIYKYLCLAQLQKDSFL